MHITYISADLFWLMKINDINNRGECYRNAGNLVLYSSFDNPISQLLKDEGWEVSYCLGILTPPPVSADFWIPYDSQLEPHAWIEAKDKDGKIHYWDPTLQGNSAVWGLRSREFAYEKHYSMNVHILKDWIKDNYKETVGYENDLPVKGYRFPIIDLAGSISALSIR